MISGTVGHIQINVDSRNLPFYRELFGFLGFETLYSDDNIFGAGDVHHTGLWFGGELKPVTNDYDGPGMNHLAVSVPKQTDVDEVVAYLQARGIPALFETPRHRPEFSESPEHTYYQVMFESPDHILFEVVYTGPKE
ncbi:MAG: VOC family protein [Anaerolineaceae bacterium]|nr:VOC family protein [Anaerolineaceae bacterium]